MELIDSRYKNGNSAESKMFQESEYLSLSALQHLVFCPRQCALIHIEQQWEENLLTAEGRIQHERVHEEDVESRGSFFIARGVRIHSRKLGLAGQADVVEFHMTGGEGIELPGRKGLWRIRPVEYKRGRPKKDVSDSVQLCAQAMCLEEMLTTCIEKGTLYYNAIRKRFDVLFDDELRSATERLAYDLHLLFAEGRMPAPVNDKRCKRCSLVAICMPGIVRADAHAYVERHVQSLLKDRETPHEAP